MKIRWENLSRAWKGTCHSVSNQLMAATVIAQIRRQGSERVAGWPRVIWLLSYRLLQPRTAHSSRLLGGQNCFFGVSRSGNFSAYTKDNALGWVWIMGKNAFLLISLISARITYLWEVAVLSSFESGPASCRMNLPLGVVLLMSFIIRFSVPSTVPGT